jgi:two-component SAPR family response regulator
MAGNKNSGRKSGFRHNEACREKIQTSQLINRLYSHFQGDVELSATQIQTAKLLLDKSLPSLQAQEVVSHNETSYLVQVPATIEDSQDWQKMAQAGGTLKAEEPIESPDPGAEDEH